MFRVAAEHRVVLELAEPAGEGDVVGAADRLIADEQDLVLQQEGSELGEQGVVVGDLGEVDAVQFRPDVGGQPVGSDASGGEGHGACLTG